MSWFLRHPRYSALNRFADGELDSREHEKVAKHLAACSRCRAEVIFIRNAGELARSTDSPPAVAAGLVDQVLERRGEGERALLPPTPPGARRERRSLAPLIAAVFSLLVAGLFAARLLEADDPGLRIQPAAPRAGDTLALEYTGDQLFADRSSLRLRARLYAAHDDRGALAESALYRDGDVFRGRLPLPDSTVFAVLAVEDAAGERLDSNLGNLWPVLVYGADGRPTGDAMAARVAHYIRRDPGRAARAAEELAEAYPDAPRSQALRLITTLTLYEPAEVADRYRPVLARFRARLDGGWAPSAQDRAWLSMMALSLGDLPGAHALFAPVATSARGEPVVRDMWSLLAYTRLGGQPDRLLAALDSVWTGSPVPVRSAADAGLRTALQTGSWTEARRWLPRYRDARPGVASGVLVERLATAFGPGQALSWGLADRADTTGSPARPLTVTRSRYVRATRQADQRSLATLAGLALSAGLPGTAHGLATDGLELAWSTHALSTIGQVLLATADTTAARLAFARAAADPAGPEPPAAVTGVPGWSRQLAGARNDLIRYVLQDAVVRYADPSLAPPDGRPLPLSEVLHGAPGVVAFLAGCGTEIGELGRLAERLAQPSPTPGTVVVIGIQSDPSLPSRLLECGLRGPVYRDPEGEAQIAFHSTAIPQYFVMGRDGRIRFEDVRLDEVPRQLLALASGDGPLAAE